VEGALAVAALPGAHGRPHELAAEGGFAAAGAAEDEGAARLGRVPLLQAVRQLHERPFAAVEALAVQQRLGHAAASAAGTHAAAGSGAGEAHAGVAAAAPLSRRRAHFCNREHPRSPTAHNGEAKRIRDPRSRLTRTMQKGKRDRVRETGWAEARLGLFYFACVRSDWRK
jgi:hypothetical protein